MRPRLIVRLSANPESPLSWVALDAQGRAEGPTVAGDAEDLATAARGRQLLGLADGRDVLIVSTRIPTQSRARLSRAIPFALEDQLTEDIDDLHFAPGDRDAAGRLWVAVVARTRMAAWLDATVDAGTVDQIHPETLALPRHDGAWTVLLAADRFLVRTGPEAGFAGDPGNLEALLEAALEEAGDEAPGRVVVYRPSGLLPQLPETGPTVEFRDVTDATALLAENLDPRHTIPLRVGRFARNNQATAQWRRWRPALALAAALLLLATGRASVEQWRLTQQRDALEQQLVAAFHSAFPGSDIPPGQLRTVMESRLRHLRQGGNAHDSGFLAMLNRVAPVVADTASVSLSALSFRGDTLELELYADSLQTLDHVKRQLAAAGKLDVQVRSAKTDGDRVQGRLLIGGRS